MESNRGCRLVSPFLLILLLLGLWTTCDSNKSAPEMTEARFHSLPLCEKARKAKFNPFKTLTGSTIIGCARSCKEESACAGFNVFSKSNSAKSLTCYLFTDCLDSCSTLKLDEQYKSFTQTIQEETESSGDSLSPTNSSSSAGQDSPIPPSSTSLPDPSCYVMKPVYEFDSSGMLVGSMAELLAYIKLPSFGRVRVTSNNGLTYLTSPRIIRYDDINDMVYFQLPTKRDVNSTRSLSIKMAGSGRHVSLKFPQKTKLPENTVFNIDEMAVFVRDLTCDLENSPVFSNRVTTSFTGLAAFARSGNLFYIRLIHTKMLDEIFEGDWTVLGVDNSYQFVSIHSSGYIRKTGHPTDIKLPAMFNYRMFHWNGKMYYIQSDAETGENEIQDDQQPAEWFVGNSYNKIYLKSRGGKDSELYNHAYLRGQLRRWGRVSISYVEGQFLYTARAVLIRVGSAHAEAVLQSRPALDRTYPFSFDSTKEHYEYESVEVTDTKVSATTFIYPGTKKSSVEISSNINWYAESVSYQAIAAVNTMNNELNNDALSYFVQAGAMMKVYVRDTGGDDIYFDVEEVTSSTGDSYELHSANIIKKGPGLVCSGEDHFVFKFILVTSNPVTLLAFGWTLNYYERCSNNYEAFPYSQAIVFAEHPYEQAS